MLKEIYEMRDCPSITYSFHGRSELLLKAQPINYFQTKVTDKLKHEFLT